MNGPVILPFLGFPSSQSGSFSNVFTAAGLVNQASTGIASFSGLLGALQTGNTYLNIHTATFPGGEVRGQVLLSPVPLPNTLALLGLGLAVLGLASSRSRWTGRSGLRPQL